MMPPRCELTRQFPFLILTLTQIGTTGHTQTAGKLLNVDCVGPVLLNGPPSEGWGAGLQV